MSLSLRFHNVTTEHWSLEKGETKVSGGRVALSSLMNADQSKFEIKKLKQWGVNWLVRNDVFLNEFFSFYYVGWHGSDSEFEIGTVTLPLILIRFRWVFAHTYVFKSLIQMFRFIYLSKVSVGRSNACELILLLFFCIELF